MFASIVSFLGAFMNLVLVGAVIAGGYFIYLGYKSHKGLMQKLKGEGLFTGGLFNLGKRKESSRDGYDRSRYRERDRYDDRGRNRYDDRYNGSYRDLDRERMEKERDYAFYADNISYAKKERTEPIGGFQLNIGGSKFLKQFKTQESFDNYIRELCKKEKEQNEPREDYIVYDTNKEETVTGVKDILKTIYNSEVSIVCSKNQIVKSVQTLQENNPKLIKQLEDRSLANIFNFGSETNEIYILVKKKGFDFSKQLEIKSPKDFLEEQLNVDVEPHVSCSMIKTSYFDFEGDVHGCRFQYVGEIKTSADDIAKSISQGKLSRKVADVIKDNETAEAHPHIKPIGDEDVKAQSTVNTQSAIKIPRTERIKDDEEAIKPLTNEVQADEEIRGMKVQTPQATQSTNGLSRIEDDEEDTSEKTEKTDSAISSINIGRINE